MRNEVYCRQMLANTADVGKKIAESMTQLEHTFKDAAESEANLHELMYNQAALEALEKHKPEWDRVIHEWLRESYGVNPAITADMPGTMKLAQLLAKYLAEGEKDMPQPATTVVITYMYHPSARISECLKVAFASEGHSEFKTGQTIHHPKKSSSKLIQTVWEILETGNPVCLVYRAAGRRGCEMCVRGRSGNGVEEAVLIPLCGLIQVL